MDRCEQIIELIEKEIPESRVFADTLDDVHFSVLVVAPSFASMSRLEQHRTVMNALKKELASEAVHAVGLKTMTPEQYEQQKNG